MPNGPFIRGSNYPGNESLPLKASEEDQAAIANYFNSLPYDGYSVSKFHAPEMRRQLSEAGRNAVNDYGDPIPLDENKYRQHSFSQFVRRNPSGIPTFRGATNHSAMGTATLTGNELDALPGYSVHDLANHEFEHARTPSARMSKLPDPILGSGVSDPAAEVPAVLGDLVFSGHALSKTLGNKQYDAETAPGYELDPPTDKRPFGLSPLSEPALKHTVQFPSGHSQNINSMIQQAEQHGYFDGKTMTELLATPEGKQYLKMITQKPPKDYDLDIKPRLAELRDEDRFDRTVRKAKAQTRHDAPLLDRMMGTK